MVPSSILIVTDTQTDHARLERIVANAGYTVLRAPGRRALETAIEERPNLVLLDVPEHDMHGFRICRELSAHSETRAIPVIVVIDRTQKVDSLWAEQQGATALVTKPYSRDQVLEQIRRLG